MRILIDGYNLIRRSDVLSHRETDSLQSGREELIKLLADYNKIKRHKITVVFDGVLNMSEFAVPYQEQGLEILFSPGVKNADQVIMDLIQKQGSGFTVVTSDREIIAYARMVGATIVDSEEFIKRVFQTLSTKQSNSAIKEEPEIKKPQHKRWATYKKGPAKRTPKKERLNQTRKKKL